MSETTLVQRRYVYDLSRTGLTAFLDAREDEGQKKYGRGKANAAYKRDNLMDVIEEVTDAITLMDYFLERIGKAANATRTWDVSKTSEAVAINNELLSVFERLDKLREWVDDSYPALLRENVKRLVVLPAQPSDRKD